MNKLQRLRKWRWCRIRPSLRSAIQMIRNNDSDNDTDNNDNDAKEEENTLSAPITTITVPQVTAVPVPIIPIIPIQQSPVVVERKRPTTTTTATSTKEGEDMLSQLLAKSRQGKSIGSEGVWDTVPTAMVNKMQELATYQRRSEQLERREKRVSDWDASLDAGRRKKVKGDYKLPVAIDGDNKENPFQAFASNNNTTTNRNNSNNNKQYNDHSNSNNKHDNHRNNNNNKHDNNNDKHHNKHNNNKNHGNNNGRKK